MLRVVPHVAKRDVLQPLFVDGNDGLAESTRQAKRMIFRTYVLPDPIARVPLHQVTEEDVRRFREQGIV